MGYNWKLKRLNISGIHQGNEPFAHTFLIELLVIYDLP